MDEKHLGSMLKFKLLGSHPGNFVSGGLSLGMWIITNTPGDSDAVLGPPFE